MITSTLLNSQSRRPGDFLPASALQLPSRRNHGQKALARATLASLLATVLLAGMLPAVAAPNVPLVSSEITVTYRKADLADPAAVAVLYKRLERAGRAVCGSYELRDLRGARAWRECYESAVSGAVLRIDSPLLVAVHHAKSRNASVG